MSLQVIGPRPGSLNLVLPQAGEDIPYRVEIAGRGGRDAGCHGRPELFWSSGGRTQRLHGFLLLRDLRGEPIRLGLELAGPGGFCLALLFEPPEFGRKRGSLHLPRKGVARGRHGRR